MTLKKLIILNCFMLILVIHSSLISQESPPYQAIITDIQGSVTIKRPQKTVSVKAVWGSQLFEGDQLKTMETASVSILFRSNNLITLGANSTLTIARNLSQESIHAAASLNLSSEFPGEMNILSFRKKENGEVSVLAGLRSSERDEIVLISPRNSKISTLNPEFSWHSKKQFESYKITIFDEHGKILTRIVNASPLHLKKEDDIFFPGKSYFWYIEGQDLFEIKRSESIGFNIPPEDELNRLTAGAEKISAIFKDQKQGSSFLFVLGSYYEKEGCYPDAIRIFRQIAGINKNAALPHQILANLYQKIGLKDLAINELQQAVELSKAGD